MAKASSRELSSALAGGADTIVARATATGRGALAVIRVSGSAAARIAGRVCPSVDFTDGWKAKLGPIHDATGAAIDRAISVAYPAARSYTGEDLFEITVHGSPFLVETVVGACLAAGARRAEAGEFTRRAVANGKLDLVQAEAIRDLVAAETETQLRNARLQVEGVLSADFRHLRDELVSLLALLEASLDFEGQAVVVSETELLEHQQRCLGLMNGLLATAVAGEKIRDGLRVVIVGAPNAGKSTLFNHLCGSERAIVSSQPGTTRDILEAELEIDGVRMVVQDTAGLRESGDVVEVEGHRRALGAAAAADLVIVMWALDGGRGVLPPETPEGQASIRVRSKADTDPGHHAEEGWLRVSCVNGEGLDDLRKAIGEAATAGVADLGGSVAIAGRHRAALAAARQEVLDMAEGRAPELAAENIRQAIAAVEGLVGAVTTEGVLDQVFNTFCIGK